MTERCLPLAAEFNITTAEPIPLLWHIPKTLHGMCPTCQSKIDGESIQAADCDWHPDCFQCSLCREVIKSDDKFVVQDDMVFHKPCIKEAYEERCATCGEHVNSKKSKKTLKALDKYYHIKCFKCARCQTLLGQTQFHNCYQMPYCKSCFADICEFFPKCLGCKQTLNPSTQKHLEFAFHGKKYYLHDPDCCHCTFCQTRLETPQDCRTDGTYIICNACSNKGSKKICAQCNEPIFDQPQSIRHIYWHAQHFQCAVCHKRLTNETALYRFSALKCRTCAAMDGHKCAECGKSVEKPISVLGHAWHKECLNCVLCKKNVYNEKFVDYRGKPCCIKCLKKLRKKKMVGADGKPIDPTDKLSKKK